MKKYNRPYPRRPAFTQALREASQTPDTEFQRKKQPKIQGEPNLWITLQRVTADDGWTKTTRAMPTPAGVLINTCSRKQNPPLVAEALQLIPGTKLDGRTIVAA